MIAVDIQGKPAAFLDGRYHVAELPAAAAASFGRPASAVRGRERLEGGIPVNERITVVVEPESAEHFRAVTLALGGSVLIDDED